MCGVFGSAKAPLVACQDASARVLSLQTPAACIVHRQGGIHIGCMRLRGKHSVLVCGAWCVRSCVVRVSVLHGRPTIHCKLETNMQLRVRYKACR